MKFGNLIPTLRLGSTRLMVAVAFALAIGLGAAQGYFEATENSLRDVGFSLTAKPPTGQIHVVEMDAASVAAIQEWPWSREHYARVLEQLDAAGVHSIGFDVDFSSHSNEAADRRFADAIEASDAPVMLPTFAQSSSFKSERRLDTLPIESLRAHAQLASVSIVPDPDGLIRRMPLGTLTSNVPRPGLSAYFAAQSGKVDESFPIDYSISATDIPRHSFVDIESGNFDPDALRGRDVLIGATAIEMGDRYAAPRNGVLPGVIIQALATETLYGGIPAYGSWILPLTIALVMGLFIMGSGTLKMAILSSIGAESILLFLAYYAQHTLLIWFDIVPALTFILASAAVAILTIVRRRLIVSRRTDAETGLPNSIVLQRLVRDVSYRHIIAARIDGFDTIKAVLSADELNLLLRRVTERLKVTAGKPVICRSNDRVLAWCTNLDHHEIEDLFVGITLVMRNPIEINGRRVDVGLTFGMARSANERALANANHAADAASRSGRPWAMHEEDQADQLERQVSMMGELDDAVNEGHIKVFYQPKLHLASNELNCAEALVRWDHPTRGLLRPDSFIPLAEESGRIEELTLFVLRTTIEDAREWCKNGIALGVAVNISARLLGNSSFVSRAEQLIDNLDIPAERLTFEVTESTELMEAEASIKALQRFKDRGIAISMDDYGTGQSTLSYIKQLPLSELKIDRSFVQNAHKNRSDAMLVRSTIQLAHELGLRVVAEGVEEGECLDFLRLNGCDYAQGFLIGEPMVADDLLNLVEAPVNIAA